VVAFPAWLVDGSRRWVALVPEMASTAAQAEMRVLVWVAAVSTGLAEQRWEEVAVWVVVTGLAMNAW